MSRPRLSDAQRAAVEHGFADAVVMAGAGSGKTRVLSERFVHLVLERHAPLRRVAALTFTEKAAAQMRDRIASLFRDLAAEHDGESARDLDLLRADVEFAPINTIHGFCALLLRQHAIEAGVDPVFQVLDADEATLLKDDAAAQAENRIAQDEPELLDIFAFITTDVRNELLELLERLRGAGRTVEAIEWLSADGDVHAAAAAVEEPLAAWARGADHLPEERRPNHADAVELIQAALAEAREGAAVTPFHAAQALARVNDLTGPRARAYTGPRKALAGALEALTGALLDAWGPRVFLPGLKRVLSLYAEAYQALKDERSALDFTDLELRARDVLVRMRDRGSALDLAPRALLVDEYQDTNPLQAEILGLLRAQAPQFSVGDPKQSIYRFRRADVHVIVEEAARVGSAAVHPMNASYRTCEPLVRGINALNQALFAGDAAGVVYEPLEAAAEFRETDEPLLELAVIDAGPGTNTTEGRACEAAWIAQRIRALVEQRTPRLAPGAEPVCYGDIAILFRAATDLPLYEAALEAEGVPFLTQKSRGYFQADEITDLIYILRTIYNPGDRFALACTATGPAMGATDDELLRWFGAEEDEAAPQEESAHGAWARMRADAEAGGRHADVLRTLEALRVDAVAGSLAAAVERALLELGLYESALLRPGGDRAAANLRKAVEIARRLDRGGRRGLADLLRHLATLREREMPEPDAPIGGDTGNVVRLTTIHGAKGLEYPIVFLADVGRQPVYDTNALRFDGAHGVAARVKDPLEGTPCRPGGFLALTRRDRREEDQESLRVLYVAMTRAEERLIVSTACAGAKKDGSPRGLRGWGPKLWNAVGGPFTRGTHDLEVGAADVRLHVVDGAGLTLPEVERGVERAPAVDDALRAEARAALARTRRDVAPLGSTRYVVTVSELLAFAESPQRYYRERVVFAGARRAVSAAWDAPPAEMEAGDAATAPDPGPRAERLEGWDEPVERHAGLDRAAVGRAVHLAIEYLRGRDEHVPDDVLRRAVQSEDGDAAFAAAVREMVERFVRSPTARALRTAHAAGADVRREVALHARIRFPGGQAVGGFDSLLVKGSIDLWLPSEDGVWIVDHKTNRAGARFQTPQDLADHYDWQLRLYALAVERVLGQDVAGARLVLLDPGWGAEAVEVEVDVTGPALEDARRLCQAFATAELEGRYPRDWTSLLE